MGASKRYLFDVSFDRPVEETGAGAPEPALTRLDIETARDAGFAAGRETAIAEAQASADKRMADALAAIARGTAALLAAQAALAQETQHQAVFLLRAVLQKVVPVLARTAPLAEIEAILSRCLAEAHDEPRLVLRVSDGLFEAAQARLQPITAASGFAGKLVLLADAALADGDCRVEWADGGAERDTKRLAAELDTLLAQALVPSPPPANSQEQVP
jgi:flagellar assembly protein FliH